MAFQIKHELEIIKFKTGKSHLIIRGEISTRCGRKLSEHDEPTITNEEEPTCKRCNNSFYSLNECPECGRVDSHPHYFN